MNRSMHKRSIIAKLYRPKKEVTKSWTGIKECVDKERGITCLDTTE